MEEGMFKNYSKDSLGLRLRVCGLHQTWKWLHQTIAHHNYLISVSTTQTNGLKQFFKKYN